ncbi:conserved hypothetical protein [Trichodesmium erythraeum IMS101]|uniref:Uncharacterized protein n=1 Tax=Trichodesmium erythraeum (strain IMS101) TaxID=203124 RepID=Q10YI0_TRIEI|nr:hypothetical protein [Trichodesmium erythraeum GBRTRLIN201]MCH2050812.1 hypothetical protein [Trichodesmium sp. ALOHA_ZT_67]MDT9338298.1 hypothetical protein [Trichodesmium erythraeum 21-75]
MSSTSKKLSTLTKSLFSAQIIVMTGLIWGVLALLFFLLFSVPLPGEELPSWYSVGTYIFELGAYLIATIISFRNWQSPQMVSGRNVWIGISLGLLFYFIGGLVFGCWELIWELDPDVSLADIFYVFSYIFLAWGMTLAITAKKLNLEFWQWVVLALVAAGGVLLAIFVADPSFFGLLSTPDTTVLEELDTIKIESAQLAPSWVLALDNKLEPFSFWLNLFYIIADVFLLIIATALLLAFWGGRFSQSWRMIAGATFSLYIADMYFKWADSQTTGEYESGGLLEVFFVFTAILFAIGAVLEYDISTRSRQSRRSRRSSSS